MNDPTGSEHDHLEALYFRLGASGLHGARVFPIEANLHADGFVVAPNFVPPSLLRHLREAVDKLFAEEGDQAGAEFRQEPNAPRLANLVAKGEPFERIVVMPEILSLVGSVLGPRFKLSSLNARSAAPRSFSRQPLHVDMGLLPDERGYAVCNTVWMLDDFTTDNGALRVVPGTHRSGQLPQADTLTQHPHEILITGEAGTVVVMNAHLWHGGTENNTDAPRRALHGFYCRWDIPQQQYQKRLIPEDVQQRFSPELRRVLALDDPFNDEISSPMKKASGFLR